MHDILTYLINFIVILNNTTVDWMSFSQVRYPAEKANRPTHNSDC